MQMNFGLPSAETLRNYRIWDAYFTPAFSHPGSDGSRNLINEIQRSMPAARLGQFEKLCYFAHVGIGTTTDTRLEQLLQTKPELVLNPMKRWPNQLLGMIQLNLQNTASSLEALTQWLQEGPMLGAYFPGSGPGAANCLDPKVSRLVERVAELDGVIMQHTWLKTGGKRSPHESTPADLAILASRYPKQRFICAHAGGEWEQGIRAVRDTPNILIETSGFDATSGFIEMATRELGSKRIVFGSHLPSRSLGTELSKVISAQISEAEKKDILGGNYRKLLNVIQAHK